ncbi:putative phage holin [Streptomyces sp. H49]|uniref:putative phage holin n=1 Tax=Streptomyces sp. H49 TaxID=3444117 RepID=UPI003F4ADE9F
MKDLGVDAWMNAVMSALGAIACAVFVATYHLRATWWRSEVGRNQMAFAVTIGLLCLYTVAATLWHEEVALIVLRSVRTVVLAAIALLMVQRTRLLLRAQQEKRDRTGV